MRAHTTKQDVVIIKHVSINDLPESWRTQLHTKANARVTVRIEEEIVETAAFVTDDPAFGIWRDRADVADVENYVRELRAPRYNADGTPRGE